MVRADATIRVLGVASTVRELARATPADRDRTVDLLRAASILVVVFGHWTMAALEQKPSGFEATNVLALTPRAWLITWLLQVMPVFFLVGGFSNAVVLQKRPALARFYATRLERLLAPTIVLAGAFISIGVVWKLIPGLDQKLNREVTRIVAQPLWFLGIYLLAILAGPLTYRLHDRNRTTTLAALGASALVVDGLRIGLDRPGLGYFNFVFVWVFAHQLGYWLHDGWFDRQHPRRHCLIAVASLGVMVALCASGKYPGSMVGLPGEESNLNPPSAMLLFHAIWMASLVALARPALARWCARERNWMLVIAANSMIMTIFLWHLPALVAGAGVLLGIGKLDVEPATLTWWLWRPAWYVLLLGFLVPLVVLLRRFEQPRWSPPAALNDRFRDSSTLATAGLVLALWGLLGWSLVGFGRLTEWPATHLLGVPINTLSSTICVLCGSALTKLSTHVRDRRPTERKAVRG